MQECYFQNNELIPEDLWIEFISSIKKNVSENKKSPRNLLACKVKEKLIESVKKRIPEKPFAILFSGGIDSTLIALISKQLGAEFTCYSVGFKEPGLKNPEDILWAEKVAKSLGFCLKKRTFSLSETEKTIKKTAKILGNLTNVVNIGVGSVFVAASELISEKVVFSGLGSEEIFAGYERHQKNPTNNECWTGLVSMYKRDFLRDAAIAKSLGFELKTPFLDKNLIIEAMRVPISMKLGAENTKLILRDAAISIGLPAEFAQRKKRAAQYGSRFDSALKKLAKKSRFKLKKDYVESLIN